MLGQVSVTSDLYPKERSHTFPLLHCQTKDDRTWKVLNKEPKHETVKPCWLHHSGEGQRLWGGKLSLMTVAMLSVHCIRWEKGLAWQDQDQVAWALGTPIK